MNKKAIVFSSTMNPDLTGYKVIGKTGEYYADDSEFSMIPDDYDFFEDENGERHYTFTTTKEYMLCTEMQDKYKYATEIEVDDHYCVYFVKDLMDDEIWRKFKLSNRIVMPPYGLDWDFNYIEAACDDVGNFDYFLWGTDFCEAKDFEQKREEIYAEANYFAIMTV